MKPLWNFEYMQNITEKRQILKEKVHYIQYLVLHNKYAQNNFKRPPTEENVNNTTV